MARDSSAAGASAPAAAVPPAVRLEDVEQLETRRFDALPEAPPAPVLASHTVEVRFLRRWRNYQAGERGNFVPSLAQQLISVGYGAPAAMTANPSRTLLVRK